MALNFSRLPNEPALHDEDIFLESLPEHVLSTMEVRDRWFARTSTTDPQGRSFVVEDLVRWVPGTAVRVAFLDGDTALHRDIEQAVLQITNSCNIRLDFGFDVATSTYRKWSTNDQNYAAEIRVSFDQDGYFSLVGIDSINRNIGSAYAPVGGRPHQRSLNLEGFHIQRPASWQATVRHEFLHALAFHHEHQNPTSSCEEEFRWQDDLGYQPTRDTLGRYINDRSGKRPGIYTYLAGYPNFWSRRIVDHNLRRLPSAGLTTGNFDRASIMLYRFPALFYRSNPSSCAPIGNGQDLSQGDQEGLRHLYPDDAGTAKAIQSKRVDAFEMLINNQEIDDVLKEGLEAQLRTIIND